MKTNENTRPLNILHRLWSIALLAAAISGSSACYVAVREPLHEVDVPGPHEEMYAPEAPPAHQSEVIIGAAPSPEYLWVGGYWTRHRDSWYWMGGRWAARPQQNAVWVQGRWDHHPRGYVWVGGYWH